MEDTLQRKNIQSSTKINTTLYPDDILTLDSTKCLVKDRKGYIKDTSSRDDELILHEGNSMLTMTHDGDCEYSRAKLTITLRGNKLQ